MPKQVGLIKIKGSVDDLTFLETQDGLIAQKETALQCGQDQERSQLSAGTQRQC